MTDKYDELGRDSVEIHEDRMELFYAITGEECPTGIDPLIIEELVSDD